MTGEPITRLNPEPPGLPRDNRLLAIRRRWADGSSVTVNVMHETRPVARDYPWRTNVTRWTADGELDHVTEGHCATFQQACTEALTQARIEVTT